ncbi:hypothetical protein [Photobacterium sp. GB-72]|uniref:hypothetical protein n=1 Tax=Photobacterium sp. GB-72 TaxID=2022105 RepID=UPI000D16087A|nr:hypothetical protein [Photobacterium sp. GB-72]PSV27616.1 hypothetical protein C9J40_19980 [Photobacterium sp. GB-72]
MTNELVKIIKNDDGDILPNVEQEWCLVDANPSLDVARVLCTQAVLDIDTNAEWEEKSVARGGITCDKCITIIKAYKAVKL